MNSLSRTQKPRAGFTLLEVMVVIVILGVLASLEAMEEKGYEILSDDLAMVPMTTTRLTDPDQLKAMGKLLDSLEDNDDVQNVWHSLENEEDLPE